MAYIGPEPKLGRNREVDDISSGFNGNATAFTLAVSGSNVSPGTANDIIVSLGGVIQNPNNDYTIAGSTLTFTQSPACGYTYTSAWTYTIPSGDATSIVSQGTYITPSFNVYSTDTSKLGTFTLELSNTITVDSGQGQSTTSFSGND